MAITATNLTAGTGASGNPQTTASVSPAANALIICWIFLGSGTITVTSVTGAGLTWVAIGSFQDGTNNKTVTAFRALGGSPSPGALTINLSGAATAGWCVDQFTGIDTSGTDGSGAIVANTGTLTSNAGATVTGTNTGVSKTIATLRNTDNATAGFVSNSVSTTPAAGSGYIRLGSKTLLASEYAVPGSTTVNFTWASTTLIGEMAAIEIARDPSDGQDWFGTDPTVTLHPLPNVGY